MNFVHKVTDWEFMNEPVWRWFVFLGALMAMGVVWNGILSFMK